jgi:hypothetical protein
VNFARFRLLATVLILYSLAVRGEAQMRLPRPDAPDLVMWEAGQSYAGGEQADPRLDRPVEFWRAGISLEEVFADVERQTGVALGFYPVNDENRRVPVHLFLNQQDPPTLRAVMAQLMWVVDCPFFVGEEPGEKAYYLMSTSIAGGADKSLQARVAAIWKAREGRWKDIGSKLDEYQQALDLSREEVIDKYQGVDDLMLLNLLDPARRAATQFTCRHMSEIQSFIEAPQFLAEGGEPMGFGTSIPASSFTPEDVADLKLAFGVSESVLRDPAMMFDLNVEAVGRMRVNVSPEYPQEERWSSLDHPGPYLLADLTEDFALSAPDELALRRALGERIPPDQEAAYLKKLEEEIATRRRERERIRLESERSLSPRATDLLESTPLVLRNTVPGPPLTPWVAQEAVARETGMNVVSDGLLWLGRYSYGRPSYGEEKTATLTALAALDTFTHAPAATGMRRPSWEWGDAGNFLRFRTADRDIWRAAMLPQEFLDWVDALLKPHLPDPEDLAKQKSLQLSTPVDLVHLTRRPGRLSDLQMRFGGDLNYGDPRELANIARHQAICHLIYGAMMRPKLTRFLASLSDAQWEQVKGMGLRCDYDLSPDQQELLISAMQRRGAPPLTLADRVIILDQEAEAHGFYSIRCTTSASARDARGPRGARGARRTGWIGGLPYANKELQVEAVAPD